MALKTLESAPEMQSYLDRLRRSLDGIPRDEQDALLAETVARVELERDLHPGDEPLEAVLQRLGSPETVAQQLRAQLPTEANATKPQLLPCRSCRREVSRDAMMCPHCGAPKPAQQQWSGSGYEWKSPRTLCGLPLVHVAWGRDASGKLRTAKGIVAIGQVANGWVAIGQLAVGRVFSLGQLAIAPIAIGQLAVGITAVGQFGFGLAFGLGMIATGLKAIGFVHFP